MIDPDAVLASLTTQDKVALLAGADNWHTVAVPGVPVLRCSDGPTGVRGTSWTGPASASFPSATALGATWDPELVERVGQALGAEARSKSAHLLLAPTVNLHRTPIGGRNFECYGEDPVLTAHLAVAYIRGVQSQGVACCIKHFIANDTEHERMTISSEVDERTLREVYLLPFEAATRPLDEGGADVRAIMSSYNRLNGTYCGEHPWLLTTVLRDEWGWDGTVISDWFGTHSAGESLRAGLDLEMPGPARERGAALQREVDAGEVSQADLDRAVLRLLHLMAWAHVGEDDGSEITADSPATRAVIREAACAAAVLLRNEHAVLPLARSTRVALIGPNAERGQVQGGGSARVRVNRPVGILSALQDRGIDVTFAEGCRIAKRLPGVRGAFTVTFTGGDGHQVVEDADRLQFLWQDDPAEGISRTDFGAHIVGTFTPQQGGEWTFGMAAVGSAVLRVDGVTVVDLSVPQFGGTFFGMGSHEIRGTATLTAGVPVHIEVEYALSSDGTLRGLQVGAEAPVSGDPIEAAVSAAAAAEVAVVVIGTDADWETEGEDRTSMALPGRQDELVHRVAAVNPRTVVVVNTGAAVSMPWIDEVAAVLQVWFPGEEVGNAVADLLFGDAEPGGRLPTTLPKRLEDTPAFEHHPGRDGKTFYAEGAFIGYRWYEREGIAPSFPFGHGLGYTTFEIGAPSVAGSIADGVTLTVPVTNTGDRRGSEVVQVYVEAPAGDPARPLRVLAGFARATLDPSESMDVAVWLPERSFSVWAAEQGWHVPAGAYRLHVARSSVDTRHVVDVVAT